MKQGILKVCVEMHSGTEFVYYPSRGQVQVLVIAPDGLIFKETTVEMEKFLDLIDKITEMKSP